MHAQASIIAKKLLPPTYLLSYGVVVNVCENFPSVHDSKAFLVLLRSNKINAKDKFHFFVVPSSHVRNGDTKCGVKQILKFDQLY